MHFRFAARLRAKAWSRAAKKKNVFFLKILKWNFQTEKKIVNAPLAMGGNSHGEESILGIFTTQTARVYLAVTGSENELNDRPS